MRRPPSYPLFPYTTLFRSGRRRAMSILQLLLVAGGLMALMIVGYVVLNGKSPAKEGQRRLQAVRYRHSESTVDKVESQLKRSEEHTSELQSRLHLVCRLLL